MAWLDKLKALFNFELNAPLINITKNSGNSNLGKEYVNSGEKIDILFDNLSKEKQEKLKLILKEKVEEGSKLLEEKSFGLLRELINFQRTKGEDKKVLDFFQNLIPKEDFEALESSLYLRRRFQEKRDVSKLKEDIRTRFGDRGKNISNLCTAGYFENFLMPLFNSSKEGFDNIYNVVVSRSPMAIFVHSAMGEDQITRDIKTGLEVSKKYGIKFLHIHGIGDQNIRTIKRCIYENKELFNYYDKEIFENNGIIIVELIL
ncbi:MAG: hypothetical protein KKF50_05165 [Nanoarchaeota archaeon]|nr:hypothetical protein [Nanoarchaeota archaeon]